MRNIFKKRDRVELLAVADADAQLAETVGSQIGAKYVCSDYRDLLGIEELDAVDIMLPHYLNEQIALAAQFTFADPIEDLAGEENPARLEVLVYPRGDKRTGLSVRGKSLREARTP